MTPRLRLRRWQARDEAAMAVINQDPEVTRYLNRPVDPAATAAFYLLVQDHWAKHGFGVWALEARGSGLERESGPEPEPGLAGQLIGFAGVDYPAFLPELATCPELGWRLARHAWGRGLATEAASAARDHAFDTLRLPELISVIHPENVRSQRLARRLGMTLSQHVHNPVLDRYVEVWQLTSPHS